MEGSIFLQRRRFVCRSVKTIDKAPHLDMGISPLEYGSFISLGERSGASATVKQKKAEDNKVLAMPIQKQTLKNTQVKIEEKNDVPFTLLLMFCFMGAVISGYLFYRSFYRIATSTAKPIARVTMKYKMAQRKLLESVSWDRIEQNSSIYNGDTIHTGDLAELTVRFIDGNVIELSDNSMVQVFLNEKGEAKADLSSGNAKVDAAASGAGFTLDNGNSSVTVTAGSTVAAATGSDGQTLQVVKGNAAVESSDGKAQNLEAGESTSTAQIVMLYPLPNERLVYYDEGTYSAEFKWKRDREGKVVLEVAEDKNFKSVISRIITDNTQAQVRLAPSRYYWRIKAANNAKDEKTDDKGAWITGRINVVQSLPPKAISPAADYLYTYRTKLPSPKLIWTESTLSSEYEVTLSHSKDLTEPIIKERTRQTSFILPPLEEGVYYWQAAAFAGEDGELSLPSEVRSFAIERKDALPSPVLYVPANKAAVNIEKGVKDINFSWKTDEEASVYRIMIKDGESTVLDEKTSSNLYGASRTLFRAGKEYEWSVTLIDGEGNESLSSEVRTFTALNGIVQQRLIEPADGYTVLDSITADMKFAWKQSVPRGMTTYFEVSKDDVFTNLLYNSSVEETLKSDVPLSVGTYYWRVRTMDESGGDFSLSSKPRRLVVVPPFQAVRVVTPNGRAVTTADKMYKFTWDAIEGAELYRIAIFDKETGSQVFSDTVYTPEASVDMFHDEAFKQRALYRYEIQGRANDNPGISSRRGGDLSLGDFTFLRLRPVTVISPKTGDVFDGIDTLLNGLEIRYKTLDPLSDSRITLSRIIGMENTVVLKSPSDEEIAMGKRMADNPLRVNGSKLQAGHYEVKIAATSIDGLDLSAEEKTRFDIKEIPSLSSAESFAVLPRVLDAEYLRSGKSQVELSWLGVKGATDYDVAVTDGKKEIVRKKVSSDIPSYTFDIMALDEETRMLFANGNFECTVTPYRRVNDMVVQSGEAARAYFSANIPLPKTNITLDAVNPYSLKGKQ